MKLSTTNLQCGLHSNRYVDFTDKNVLNLVSAINSLPSLKVEQVTDGEDNRPVLIFFSSDFKSEHGLFFLLRCINRHYFKHGLDWSVEMESVDKSHDGGMPFYFVLSSHSNNSKAFSQAADLVENMNNHLNSEVFMNSYDLNSNNFITE